MKWLVVCITALPGPKIPGSQQMRWNIFPKQLTNSTFKILYIFHEERCISRIKCSPLQQQRQDVLLSEHSISTSVWYFLETNRECIVVGRGPVKWCVNGRTPQDRAVASTVWHVKYMHVPFWIGKDEWGGWFCVNQSRIIWPHDTHSPNTLCCCAASVNLLVVKDWRSDLQWRH